MFGRVRRVVAKGGYWLRFCPSCEANPTNLHGIQCVGFLLKFVDAFRFYLQSDKNESKKGNFTWWPTYVYGRISQYLDFMIEKYCVL